jgi:hypothetical protein
MRPLLNGGTLGGRLGEVYQASPPSETNQARLMKTALDNDDSTWLLESLSYSSELHATVVELFKEADATSLEVAGQTIGSLHALEPSPSSRKFTISFSRIVAWQVVNESYTTFDKSEQDDGEGFLRLVTGSAYLSYVQANHGWFVEVVGVAQHYRLWTEDEVLDVIAHTPPVIAPC